VTAGTGALLRLTDLHHALDTPIAESMNFLDEVTHQYPDAISFAAGRPYEGFFDLDDVHYYLERYRDHAMAWHGDDEVVVRRLVLQYGRTKGIIHDLIAQNLAVDEDIKVSPESIVVTVGCQEALFLTLRALRRDENDVLLTALPRHVGVTGAAHLADMRMLPVREDSGGLDVDDLVDVVRRAKAEGLRPRACYVVADFANPSGTSLSRETRKRLLQAAEEHDFLILEDNPYGVFDAGGERPPTMKSIDTLQRVVYLGSFAKTGFPGARIGYVVADQRVARGDEGHELLADQLGKLKSMLTVNTSPIAQAVIGGKLLANDYSLRTANTRQREVYRRNLCLLVDELNRWFPPDSRRGVSWNVPAGGFFLVLKLPFEAGDDLLEYSAREHRVLWAPMHHFYGDGIARDRIRLAFSHLTPDEITAGVSRLAAFVSEQCTTRREG
jgi:(S)-3,5-dihydroxyphenylglycine transaminase